MTLTELRYIVALFQVMKAPTVLLLVMVSSAAWPSEPAGVSAESSLRDALFTRTFGDERFGQHELDILYWSSTRHLLTEPSHTNAIRALDEFIANHGEQNVREPLRRALLQRDLWQLYEWTFETLAAVDNDFKRERAELRSRLATAIKRMAQTPTEIAQLPGNLETISATAGIPDFPRGLPDGTGDWVMVGTLGDEAAAPEHALSFDGHSLFIVLVRLPGGRTETLAYLKKMREIAPRGDASTLQNLPAAQFPAGTLWSLMRIMMVIDADGIIVPTHLVETIQIRRYLKVPAPDAPPLTLAGTQQFFEINLDREQPPTLRVIDADERRFLSPQFRSMGIDDFEFTPNPPQPYHPSDSQPATLKTCGQCHGPAGIMSVRSYLGFMGRKTPANVPTTLAQEAEKTIGWAQGRPEWQELSRLWAEAR